MRVGVITIVIAFIFGGWVLPIIVPAFINIVGDKPINNFIANGFIVASFSGIGIVIGKLLVNKFNN